MNMSASLNVGDLAPYMKDDFKDLRALFQEGRLMHTKL